jgi:hypothetical protein
MWYEVSGQDACARLQVSAATGLGGEEVAQHAPAPSGDRRALRGVGQTGRRGDDLHRDFRPGRLTAAVMIGFWFVIQLISGIGSITSAAQSGVAYFAHTRGFVAGPVLVKFFGAGRAPDAGWG